MRKLALLTALAATAAVLAIPVAFGHATKTVVAVKLKEFKVLPSTKVAKAGAVAFAIKNTGKLAHEFVVVKTSLPPGKLPVKNSRVTLKPLRKVGPFNPGTGGSLTVPLKPGRYVLFCNVAGHYSAGQYVGFVVK